jgi:hypothetical protein
LRALLIGPDASGKNATPTGVFQFLFFVRKKLRSKKKRCVFQFLFFLRKKLGSKKKDASGSGAMPFVFFKF